MKVTDLTTAEDLHTGDLNDSEYRAEWERTRLAHEVATHVIAYCVEHKLTQKELARILGMPSPTVPASRRGNTSHRLPPCPGLLVCWIWSSTSTSHRAPCVSRATTAADAPTRVGNLLIWSQDS